MSKVAFAVSIASLALIALLLLQNIGYQDQIGELNSRVSSLESQLASLRRELREASKVIGVIERTVTHVVNASPPSTNVTLVYEAVKDSVVEIRTLYRFGEAVGSGFIYDAEGHVVTNNHVVEGGVAFYVFFIDGSSFRAELVGSDPDTDLAVLRIVSDGVDISLRPLRLGDSSELRIGETVIAIGNPFELTGSVTVGVVSQKGRLLSSSRGYLIPGIIQVDAAVNPGNSGGPILNLRGEVVGVATAIESMTGQFAGVGFAISSNVVKRVVPALISSGSYKHSYLGIAGSEINALVARELGLSIKRGLLVENVVPGGPADMAGLRGGTRTVTVAGRQYRVGGDIIVAINGTPISSMDDLLTYMVEKTSPGDVVVVTVIRGGSRVEVEVTLGARP